MERDLKFEVQFLLSLTLVVFGLLSVREIRPVVNIWIGIGEIFLLSAYFSMFMIFYSLHRNISISLDFIESLNRMARPTLLVVSVGFAYTVGHVALAVGYEHFLEPRNFTSTTWRMIIVYLGPTLPIGIMTIALYLFALTPLTKYSDLNVKIVPKSIRIYPNQEDTRPLSIKIENEGEDPIEWEMTIEIPEDVQLHTDEGEFRETYQDQGELKSGRAFRESFTASHSSSSRASDLVTVEIDLDGASISEEVDVVLET